MFFGTFWEHHTCLYIYHVLIIKHLNTILCYSEEIAKYVPIVVKLCYAIAGVVAVVGAISVYIAMNNEEQDVKKKIMMIVGACIFLVAAAQALPLFFGVTN
jgi:predicted small integral membrane protein